MPSRGQLSALALAEIAGGVILAWSGVTDASLAATLKAILSGKAPQPDTGAQPIAGEGAVTTSGSPIPESGGAAGQINATTPGSGTDRQNEALGRLMAAGYGWAAGSQWAALNYGWGTLESSWNAQATNSTSGAFGIAQAYNHGNSETAAYNSAVGRTVNEYGPLPGMSVSNATCKAANAGSATAQIAWGLDYIHVTYPGGPDTVPGWTGGAYSGY